MTLVETMLAVLLFAVLLLCALALWDSAGRLNKSEIDVADAQGSLRFALHQMARVVRTAGAGGLFVTQSVLVRPDPGLPGVATPPDDDYDNVVAGTVTDLAGKSLPVRPGTDVLEVRGVIFSPLLGFDGASGCGACNGTNELRVRSVTDSGHVNDDPARRPRFQAIDSYTAGVSDRHPMFVLAVDGDDLHPSCSDGSAAFSPRPAQPSYHVGLVTAPTALSAAGTLGTVDFSDRLARELVTEDPRDPPPATPDTPMKALRRAGILDDVLFFINNTDPVHPALARAVRRGERFDVAALAEDVEDLQVAYGVDGLYGSDDVTPDGVLGRLVATTEEDPDSTVSTRTDGDEWAPNVEGERLFTTGDLQSSQPPPPGFPHTGASDAHCPTLSAVMIALVAKARDPDPTFRGRGAFGLHALNSPKETRNYPLTAPRYRRRIQTATVGLRNFGATR
jgi:type II secretory pathway pseudopilin PulG